MKRMLFLFSLFLIFSNIIYGMDDIQLGEENGEELEGQEVDSYQVIDLKKLGLSKEKYTEMVRLIEKMNEARSRALLIAAEYPNSSESDQAFSEADALGKSLKDQIFKK